MAAEEGLMGLGAALVPSFEGVGLTLFDLVNFPFHGDDPVGHHGSLMGEKSFTKAFPGPPCGNHPRDFADFPRGTQPAKEFRSKGLIRIFARKRSVEVGADEFGLQWGRLNS